MNAIFAALSIACLLFMNGCISVAKKPEFVVESFFDALKDKDFETAKELSTEESGPVLDMINIATNFQTKQVDSSLFDKSKLNFGPPKINGDSALINVSLDNNDEFITLKLKKENGDWKVAFDFETLMKISLDKIKSEGGKAGQKLDKQLESIQKLPLDSLIEDQINSFKKLDSVQKTLNNL